MQISKSLATTTKQRGDSIFFSDLRAGDEITYNKLDMSAYTPKKERLSALKSIADFDCNCNWCLSKIDPVQSTCLFMSCTDEALVTSVQQCTKLLTENKWSEIISFVIGIFTLKPNAIEIFPLSAITLMRFLAWACLRAPHSVVAENTAQCALLFAEALDIVTGDPRVINGFSGRERGTFKEEVLRIFYTYILTLIF
jgi:hypothetical protein